MSWRLLGYIVKFWFALFLRVAVAELVYHELDVAVQGLILDDIEVVRHKAPSSSARRSMRTFSAIRPAASWTGRDSRKFMMARVGIGPEALRFLDMITVGCCGGVKLSQGGVSIPRVSS